MPQYTRQQLLEAVRTDHPEFKSVADDALYNALAQDHPELVQGIADPNAPNFSNVKSGSSSTITDQLMRERETMTYGDIDPAITADVSGKTAKGLARRFGIDPDAPISGTAKNTAGLVRTLWNAANMRSPEGQIDPLAVPKLILGAAGGLARNLMNVPGDVASGDPERLGGAAGTLLQTAPMAAATADMAAPLVRRFGNQINPSPLFKEAGSEFNQLRKAAQEQNLPVEFNNTEVALRNAMKEKGLGGGNLPTAMQAYIARQKPITAKFAGVRVSAQQPPITLEESMRLASNAGRNAIARAESEALSGSMKAQLNKFAKALDSDNRAAFAKEGLGDVFDSAMSKWGKAASIAERNEILTDALKQHAIKIGLTAAGLGGGAYLVKKALD